MKTNTRKTPQIPVSQASATATVIVGTPLSLKLVVSENDVSGEQHLNEIVAARKLVGSSQPQLSPISGIFLGLESLRCAQDLDASAYLVECYKDGALNIPPIIVRNDGSKRVVIDGRRRFQAAKVAGVEEISCIEISCSTSCALALALTFNAPHGCRINRFEIREHIKTILAALPLVLEELASHKTSYRKVASEWGVSKDTVQRALEELTRKEQPKPTSRSAADPNADSILENGKKTSTAPAETMKRKRVNRAKSTPDITATVPAAKQSESKLRDLVRELLRVTDEISAITGVPAVDVYRYATAPKLENAAAPSLEDATLSNS